ncbi:MAG: quinone-dependent dihydroorotate dehydrogenase [Balneolaceae bacterium]
MYKSAIRPILFRLSADNVHEATLRFAGQISRRKWLLRTAGKLYSYSSPALRQKIWGFKFPNPIGLAAGFDKNGTIAPVMEKIGFGFVEIGSVTANPSAGNPKPRNFRLPEDQSLINRLGLNNDGAATISKRVRKLSLGIPIGINIAKTHDPSIFGEKARNDYKESFNLFSDFADYITINISCPNTGEGKTFEEPEALNSLLDTLQIEKDSSLPPVLIKFSVDLSDAHLAELITICEKHAVSGYVATNTSSLRENLVTSAQTISSIGKGGLSGRAIAHKSTAMIEKVYAQTKGEKTIIGVGGISSGQDAIDKLKAGADLLQIYTSLIYEGPGIVKRINKEIAEYLEGKGLSHIYQIHSATD